MSEYKIKLWEELDTNTDIDWWNTNREKLNKVIRMVNDWQINHRQDPYYAELVLAKIQSIKDWNEEFNQHDLSEWQLEMLAEIKFHVIEVIDRSE